MKQKILKCATVSLCLLVSGVLFAQKTITGTITDEAGVPLPGATIIVVETNEGTTTDFDGNYSILASDGNTIDISYIGYTNQSISVADGAEFSVSLQPDSLDEVVVTALGIKRNTKALGYSVTQVGGESVSQKVKPSVVSTSVGGSRTFVTRVCRKVRHTSRAAQRSIPIRLNRSTHQRLSE